MRESVAFSLNVPTPEDMRRLGAALGSALASGAPGVRLVGIEGDLGAGKTVFVSGVLAALGVAGSVRSPTYTLVEPYECPARTLYHLDLYRLADPQEVEALGVRDLMSGDAVLLVEWPERAGGALPPADLAVRITYIGDGDAGRVVGIEGRGPAGRDLAAALADAVKAQ